MRKISKAPLYPPGGDQLDARPRGVSGGTITSGSGSHEIDLAALFAKPADQVTIAGAGATAGQPTGNKSPVSSPDSGPVTFTTTSHFAVVATV